ncbi:hypothetical protein EYF80_024786 [Liparis tanakae]|uniref:Uncharacterized protein n=1 Tax=Liparis tanakae TaxID=230148 RepID=A0A4Z2HGR3_9TELE|nr:hypothetical protein EYF80_024786 [Liparis tanakae]
MLELCVRRELAGLGGVGALLHVDPHLWWMTRFDEKTFEEQVLRVSVLTERSVLLLLVILTVMKRRGGSSDLLK